MTELASLAAVSAAAARRDHVGAPPPVEASAQPGGEGLPSLPLARAVAPGPKWFRLPEASWAMIRAEYLAGATAKQLALKWGVSPTSVYRHACKEGFTKARRGEAINLEAVTRFAARAAEVEARALAAARGEAEAPAGAQIEAGAVGRREIATEADPLRAARTLLRRAAGAALHGRVGPAQEGMKLASDLLRGVRLLTEAQTGGRFGFPAAPDDDDDDDDDDEREGWGDSEESQALNEKILRGLDRICKARGRTPPQRLPLHVSLEDYPDHRPLAEALGLVSDGRDLVNCPDFDAAVARARAEGRGEAVDRALSEPVAIEHRHWLDDAARADLSAREAEAATVTAEAGRSAWARAEEAERPSEEAAGPSVRSLHHDDEPWRLLPRRRPGRISEP